MKTNELIDYGKYLHNPYHFTEVHEAGHAVVASYLRVPFKYVTTAVDIKNGHVGSFGHLLPRHRIRIPWNEKVDGKYQVVDVASKQRRMREYWENYTIMCYGGAAATELYWKSTGGSENDQEQIVEVATNFLQIPTAKLGKYVRQTKAKARKIVRLPWASLAIYNLAVELDDHVTVRAGRVRRLCAEAKRTFADDTGRRSMTPGLWKTR